MSETIYRTEDGREFTYEWEAQNHANDLAKQALEDAAQQAEIERRKRLAQAHYEEGCSLMNRGDTDGAIKEFTESIAQYQNSPAYIGRGLMFAKREEHERAIKDYSTAISMTDCRDRVTVYQYRYTSYAKLGDLDNAVWDLAKVCRIFGTTPVHNKDKFMNFDLVRDLWTKSNGGSLSDDDI